MLVTRDASAEALLDHKLHDAIAKVAILKKHAECVELKHSRVIGQMKPWSLRLRSTRSNDVEIYPTEIDLEAGLRVLR